MAVFPTFADLMRKAKREALSRPTRLTPEIFDVAGSDVNIAMAAGAAMAQESAAYAQGRLNANRLATAASVGEDELEQWGASEVNEIRSGASSAIVPIVWRRDPGGPTVVPAGTLVGTRGGVTFSTVAALQFAANETGPLTIAALASTAGPGGNVIAGSITEILSTLADPTFTINNDEPASGGRPTQPPSSFQAQCQSAYQRARKATLVAIEEDAKLDGGVASARAYEVLDGDAQTGRVVVQILGHGGTTNSALGARVRARLDGTRAAGVPVLVHTLNPRTVSVRFAGVKVKQGFDPQQVLGQAAASIVAYLQAYQVGQTLFVASLMGLAAATDGLEVPKTSLITPSDDVIPGAGEYLTTQTSMVLLTVETV